PGVLCVRPGLGGRRPRCCRRRRPRCAYRAGRRGTQAVAGDEGRGGASRRARDRAQLPRSRRGRACRRAPVAGQRLQGSARAWGHGAHVARSRGGVAVSAVGIKPRATGAPTDRLDGPAKVTGTAPYAFEHPLEHPAYLHPVQATIARGRVVAVDTAAAAALDGVLIVVTHLNAPRLASDE